MGRDQGAVVAVSMSPEHGFSKSPQPSISLVAGMGVAGDAHAGKTVQHLYRVRLDPTKPNLAQVHFLHAELFEEVAADGFDLAPGVMGENVLTRGLDLLGMPTGAVFRIGDAVVEISGIRNPCKQIDGVGKGLKQRLIEHGPAGEVLRKAGIMGIVREGGTIRPGDMIRVELPPVPHLPLAVV